MKRVRTFIRARISPTGTLGLHLTIGALLLTGAVWLFGSIAENVVSAGAITQIDVQVAHWFHAHASPPFTRIMFFITHAHSTPGIALLAVLLAMLLKQKKEWYWLLTLAVTVPGGMLLNVLLKLAFERARPSFDDPFLSLTTFSFPSGHASGATLFYGVLSAYLVCRVRSWSARMLIVLFALLMIAAVGASRIYLGVHYLSDVLGAIAASCAWLALCLTTVASLRRHQKFHRRHD